MSSTIGTRAFWWSSYLVRPKCRPPTPPISSPYQFSASLSLPLQHYKNPTALHNHTTCPHSDHDYPFELVFSILRSDSSYTGYFAWPESGARTTSMQCASVDCYHFTLSHDAGRLNPTPNPPSLGTYPTSLFSDTRETHPSWFRRLR